MSLHLNKKCILVKLAEKGMSYADLAREMKPPRSRQAVTDMLCRIGKGQGVTSITGKRIADAVGCVVTELVDHAWIMSGKVTTHEGFDSKASRERAKQK